MAFNKNSTIYDALFGTSERKLTLQNAAFAIMYIWITQPIPRSHRLYAVWMRMDVMSSGGYGGWSVGLFGMGSWERMRKFRQS